MTVFWIGVALLCAAAVAFLLVPLWRHHRRSGHWSPVGLVVVVALVPVAIALYFQVSDWDPSVGQRAAEGTRLVTELAARLEQSPDDLEGWRLLAGSYMALGRYDQGRAAYQQVWARTPTPDNDLKIEFAEAQILTDRGSLVGEAGRLVEEVLVAQPGNPKALWYGGLVALELGREDIVRTRWTTLLALNPPEQVASIVRAQLESVGNAAGAGGATAATPAPTGPSIKLAISLGAGRSIEQLGPGAQLFIFARAPEGGPPLAVIRQPATAVPGEFTLSDANSMIQGRSLANYQELALVARLSVSGQPTPQSGDWFAETVFRPGVDNAVALVIDQVVQ